MTALSAPRSLPQCWGHRGASAAFPENTLASFEAAIRDGAEGIESDVHVSLDDVVLMFHDPSLGRTTDGKGLIREKRWEGDMENTRTIREPRQAIPTFAQTIELLMRPENAHAQFNVDVKVQNDPERLFKLMRKTIEGYADWENTLAPRILLGLWHPKFIDPAKQVLPELRRAHIGSSPHIAKEYFWESCESFSLDFASLSSTEGEKFRKECKVANKKLLVWTVNKKEEMIEAARWGVDVILTDVTAVWLQLRAQLHADFDKTSRSSSRWFLWTSPMYYYPARLYYWSFQRSSLERAGGKFPIPPSRVL
ncbi:PLC-like phosphodiesterase [Ceratobasidium sp. AG-I]|nr:PLC-like phosphodiesterase [Ceratobasidium sp. AG-I]